MSCVRIVAIIQLFLLSLLFASYIVSNATSIIIISRGRMSQDSEEGLKSSIDKMADKSPDTMGLFLARAPKCEHHIHLEGT